LVRMLAIEAVDLGPGVATPQIDEPRFTRDDDHGREKTP
ncbi:MAG: hypothetical protein QOC92_3359, partial [Acidimicrobiaceae bacterium]